MAATALLVIAWWLVVAGLKRNRQQRRELKSLRQRAEAGEEQGRHEHARRPTEGQASPPSRSQGADESFDTAPREP